MRCAGSFADCLAPPAPLTEDLLCVGHHTHDEQPSWEHWWWRFGDAVNLTISQLHNCFFPIRRLSWRAMRVLADDLPRAAGFFEVLYPSWLHYRGLTIGTIPSRSLGHVGYWWGPEAADAPPKREFIDAMQKGGNNRLYHPVKI